MDQRAAAIVEKRKEANALPVDFTIAPGAFMPLIRAAQNRGLGIREYEAAFGILLNNLEYKHAHGVAIPHQIDADTMKQLMEQIYSENLRIAKPINTTESVVGQIYTLSAMVNPEEMMDLGYGVVNQLNVTALPVLSSRGDKGPDRSKLSPDVIPYHISLAPELEDEKNEGTRIIFGKEKIGAFTMGLHWIKTHFANIPIIDPPEGFDLHITAGHGQLTPTEGFSAGGAQTAAMVSALTGIPIKGGLVSTGAINDQGDIIGIASLESKLGEAALRGATRAIIAKDNIDDYNRLPDVIKNQFKEVYAVDNIKQFLLLALDFNEDTLSKLSKVDLDQTRKFKAWLEEDKNYTDLSSPPPAERAKQRRGRKKAA
jgi:hypothetical protein